MDELRNFIYLKGRNIGIMTNQKRDIIARHIKTHSERSAEDSAAVRTLDFFLRSKGKINTNFASNDKWPNTDGTFELVTNPNVSRSPEQNFFVQIKGTHIYRESDEIFKYSLQSLAFPAFIYCNVTLDPGILFVVLNPDNRGTERVFWKYMSANFLNSIKFEQGSATIGFTAEEEIKDTDESINAFCDELEKIANHHSFVSQLDQREYSKDDIKKIIYTCDEQITESIERMDIANGTRDNISKRILTRLNDLCTATLLFNTLSVVGKKANLQLAWEQSLLNIETKYLGTFFKGLKYIGSRIPDDGQSERLMLKYYDFLWQIRKSLQERYGISVLHNLEEFPLKIDNLDYEYYELVANTINSAELSPRLLCKSRFYIQKKVPFFIGAERYYEVTLQLAGGYSTKYNRITAYTKENISSDYSVQIAYIDAMINLWGIDSKIKVITNWQVSIDPSCLNKLAKILSISMKLTSNHGEYAALMNFLTRTGINFLDLIDLQEVKFSLLIDPIYQKTKTSLFKDALVCLKNKYSKASTVTGRNVIRYLLLNLREETINDVLPTKYYPKCISGQPHISARCYPFEKNPFLSNLAGRKTSEVSQTRHIVNIVGDSEIETVRPYVALKNAIKQTGEIYFETNSIANEESVSRFNSSLDVWESRQGYRINQENGLICIGSYEKTTINILQRLLDLSKSSNKGQHELNQKFIEQSNIDFTDNLKKQALREIFVESQMLLIYGAAGTGKTTLIDYISNLMAGRRKLFLTKTHTALQNLKRRINNPGSSADFVSIDSFTKRLDLEEYDIIFIDECSTIDNRTMLEFIKKLDSSTFLVLAGDIYQIESIDFGNWFFYAKDIIKACDANVELLSTWRTKDEELINLWNEVRTKSALITEKLVIDGAFSEDIGENVFNNLADDEVVLCLNYDGKFGLNNMNNYFQNANKKGEAVLWEEWSYKVGDPILFNGTKRFSLLYNNLKGRIVVIEKDEYSITFTIDVDTLLTEKDCQREDLEFVDIVGNNSTRIRFAVYAYGSSESEEDIEEMRLKSVIPFQLAYAVSIHKAQGLEYDSVKVIIPSSNSEKITHGVFYTAITRAKKSLKIYWSAETMKEVIKNFSMDESNHRSLEIVRSKLLPDN